MSASKILVVDDERAMRAMLEVGLAQRGFDVRCVADGRAALAVVQSAWRPDAIVLDVMMPKVDGIALISMLRRSSEAPIVMLSARKEIPEKILALTAGADDYVGKPFDLGELAARLQSRIRRPQLAARSEIECGGLYLNLDTREARYRGRSLVLSVREFDVLATFAREPGRVFTREQLIDAAWGKDAVVEPNVVETYVSYLRSKLDDAPGKRIIHTVRRIGYVLRVG